MIRHTVLFRFDDDAPLAEIREKLEALVGPIPGLRSVWFGIGGSAGDTHTAALITEHDDWAALNGYEIHPNHRAVAVIIRKHLTDRASVDAEY